jgi:hypothetical protein
MLGHPFEFVDTKQPRIDQLILSAFRDVKLWN